MHSRHVGDLRGYGFVRYDGLMVSEIRPEFEPLPETLRRRRINAFIVDALTIRDHADVCQRDAEARRHLREAVLLYATGRISVEQRDRVFDILSFAAQPPATPELPTGLHLDNTKPHGSSFA